MLSKLGNRNKLLNAIRSTCMYENVRSRVPLKGFQSDFFISRIGSMQDEVSTPILYNMYVNDFELHFVNSKLCFFLLRHTVTCMLMTLFYIYLIILHYCRYWIFFTLAE
jgi:hypothetical protein